MFSLSLSRLSPFFPSFSLLPWSCSVRKLAETLTPPNESSSSFFSAIVGQIISVYFWIFPSFSHSIFIDFCLVTVSAKMTQDVEMKELQDPSNSVASTSPSTLHRKISKSIIYLRGVWAILGFPQIRWILLEISLSNGVLGNRTFAFRFEGDCSAYRDRRFWTGSSKNSACCSPNNGLKAKVEVFGALCFP